MTKKTVTMQMIADHLGITKVSVSKALNNQPGISDDLKKRILEVSHEMGYFRNSMQKPVEEVKKLGFLVPKRFFLENDKFYTMIYYYLSRECAQKNINLMLYIISPTDEKNLALPFSFLEDNLDGLFVAGEIDNPYVQSILKLKTPMVAIDFYKHHMPLDCIVTDNFYSSYLAVTYLIDRGHRSIGFIGNANYTSSVMDRYYGYLKALAQNGITFREEWHIADTDTAGVYSYDYPLPNPLPSAFICHCDASAHHLMMRLQCQGIAIPEQVSVVSFDNTELSQNCNPPLTSIDINKREFAHKSLQQMLWRINNPSAEPQRIILNTHLIERNSVKKL